MEEDVRRFLIFTGAGMLLLFPVFNQVSATVLDTLYDADHQAKFSDLFKGWDDIPEDVKVSYWDGRQTPPGASEFDRDRFSDDGSVKQGADPNGGPDADGDGVPDDEDADPEDPDVQDEEDIVRYENVTEVLWSFDRSGQGSPSQNDAELIDLQRHYLRIDVTYGWSGFTGSHSYDLKNADGATVWSESGGQGPPMFDDDQDEQTETVLEEFEQDLYMDYTYSPLANQSPDDYLIEITGTYQRPIEE